jgi:hypothetical protein
MSQREREILIAGRSVRPTGMHQTQTGREREEFDLITRPFLGNSFPVGTNVLEMTLS